ncbi:MAG TPA: hypothetical protein VGD84_18480 [Pseudonocardiaceae bacterium]
MDDLLARQERLQQEAHEVMTELDLPAMLGRVGRVEVIGSAASGLMVWRDLDISVYTDAGAADRVAAAMRALVANPAVLDLHYANETGSRSPSGGAHDQRYYAVVRYLSRGGEHWKIDLSLWTDTGPRGEFSAERLRDRLTDETRIAILRIKDDWHRHQDYPDKIGGIAVYDAVLNHGVRTAQEFGIYLSEHDLMD